MIAENHGNLIHAAGLYFFALDEFGKALYLQETEAKEKVRTVPLWLFGRGKIASELRNQVARQGIAHSLKIRKALDNLPEECEALFRAVCITDAFSKDTRVKVGSSELNIPSMLSGIFEDISGQGLDFDTRNVCFYVDYQKGGWNEELSVDKGMLLVTIDEFQKRLGNK